MEVKRTGYFGAPRATHRWAGVISSTPKGLDPSPPLSDGPWIGAARWRLHARAHRRRGTPLETRTSSSGRAPLVATLIATVFGAGLLPFAPGTWGTVVAVPIAWALGRVHIAYFIATTIIIAAVGSIAADVYCKKTGRHDNQQIVVDEVAGYLVTMLLVPCTVPNLLAGFVLFRLFDIWKPPPVRWIDRNVGGGFGVVADDLAAGVYAALLLFALHHYGALGRLDL